MNKLRPLCLLLLLIIPFVSTGQDLTLQMSAKLNEICNGGCDYDGPSILINEVMLEPVAYNGSIFGNPLMEGEWIELYNPDRCKAVDISCYFLGNASPEVAVYSTGFVIPEGTIVPPMGFVIVRGRNAPAVPSGLLVANGGNTVEVVVEDSLRICLGGGTRLWFPNSGGWFAFFDNNGVPQDAICWGRLSYSLEMTPACNPGPINTCSYSGNLLSYNDIPSDKKTRILRGGSTVDKVCRRIPDGGNWAVDEHADATYGTCNTSPCVTKPTTTCNGTATVSISGGTPPYSIRWDDIGQQTTNTATGLCKGVYCATVTDKNNQKERACVEVNNLELFVTASSPFSEYCEGEEISFQGSVSNGEFPYKYKWKGPNGYDVSTQNPAITNSKIDNSGLYELEVVDSNNCKGSSSANIMVNSILTLSAKDNGPYCEGDTILLCLDTNTVKDIIWEGPNGFRETGDNVYIYDAQLHHTGDYTVSVPSNSPLSNCATSAMLHINVSKSPKLKVETIGTFCKGNTVQLKADTDAGNVLWNTGAATQSIQVADDGYYVVEAEINSCKKSSGIQVKFNENPKVDIVLIGDVCKDDTIYLKAETSADTILWDTGGNKDILPVVADGSYEVEVIKNGCRGKNKTDVKFLETPQVTILQIGDACKDSEVTLRAETQANSIQWSTGQTQNEIRIKEAGSYQVSVEKDGCVNTAVKQIWMRPQLMLYKEGDECADSVIKLWIQTDVADMSWNTGETSGEIYATQSGWYKVNVRNPGCVNTDSIEITFLEIPQVKILQQGDLCKDKEIRLYLNTNANSFQWSTGAKTQDIKVNKSGTYSVTAEKEGCENTDEVLIEFGKIPELSIQLSGDPCENKGMTLHAETDASKVLWNTGESRREIHVTEGGMYSVTAWEGNCSIRNEKAVSFFKKPIVKLMENGDYCKGGFSQLVVETDYQNILWNTLETESLIDIREQGLYTVTVSSEHCRTQDSILILCDCELQFPNAFNPDGILDNYFGPAKSPFVLSFKMYIYDRWGKMIFETHSMDELWNGKIDGKMAPQGGYVYVAYYLCKGYNTYKEKHGSFLLVR